MLPIFLLLNLVVSDNPTSLRFELDLDLGTDEKSDHFLFSADTVFSVQDSGQIAILDVGNKRVLLFSEKGEFLFRMGRNGEGPGEFTNPSEIANDDQGNLYIFDAQALKIIVFDAQGTFIKNIRLPQGTVGLLQPNILPNGNIVLSTVQLDKNQQQVYCLSLFNPQMELIRQLDTRSQPPLDWSQSDSSAFWVTFLKDHLEGIGKGFPLSAANGQGFVTVQTNSYSGSILDQAGSELGHFSRPIRPLMMSDEMRQKLCEEIYQKVAASGSVAQFIPHGVFLRAMATADLPPTVNPIAHLFSTNSGFGVLVNYDSVKQQGQVELFDQKGQFLQGGTFRGLASAVKWSQNKWYTMGENEDGIQVLHRYNVVGAAIVKKSQTDVSGH